MKKLFLSLALLCISSMALVHATDYYVAGTMNGWNTTSNDNKMSLVSGTVYSKTISAMAAASYEFKISTYNWESDWGTNYIDNSLSNVTLGGSGNISFTLSTTSDVTFYFDAGSTKKIYVQATPAVVPSYTFDAGTTIYYDFTGYGDGVNLFNSDWNNEWKSDVSAIISKTLSSAWELTASSSLFKSAASSWNIVTCSTLPTEGQNMLVSTDGVNYHWDTYSGGATPTYTFTSGTKLYFDFTAVTGDAKGVNFPYGDKTNPLDYDENGAGKFIKVTISGDVEWATNDVFVKTQKAGWTGLNFTIPEDGQNWIKVAADGASYTWDTYVDPNTDFYLAGSFNDWNTTSDCFVKASGDATEASVTITINEYSNIEFKVMDDGAYCGSDDAITKDANTATIAAAGSGENIAMTPYAAGDYVFTLNLSTRVLTVTYPDGDPMPIPKNIYLVGGINEWATADDDYKFSVDEANDIATLELALAVTTDFEFKLMYNGAWMGGDYNFNYYWRTDVEFNSSKGNAAIYTFKAGTYTFRYKLSTSELSIDYPATSATAVSVSKYEYATLYSATAFDVPNEVEAYVVTGNEGIRLTMERIYRIPAQTGVLLHAAEGNYNFYEGDGRYMDAVTGNYLHGTLTDTEINNDAVHYVLSYTEDDKVGLFWPYGTGATAGVGAFTNKAGKAYLEMNSQPAGVAARRGYLLTGQEDIYTSLEDMTPTLKQGKFIENGQLLINHEGKIYNAQGIFVR